MGNDTPVNSLAMFAPIFLLEPFLVTYLGSTLGQYFMGMQIVRVDTNSKCPLLMSFPRYYTKLLLGGLSVIYMLFSGKHQAIHDHLAKTVVVLSSKKIEKKPTLANKGEPERILDADYIYPSAMRRFGIFILWAIFANFIIGLLAEISALLILPDYTLETGALPESIEITVGLISLMISFVLAMQAAKGRLPGAKRKRRNTDSEQ